MTLDDLIGVVGTTPEAPSPPVRPEWRSAERAVDEIRNRFGHDVIGPASTVRDHRLRLVRRGAQQWGPERAPVDHGGTDGRPGAPPDGAPG